MKLKSLRPALLLLPLAAACGDAGRTPARESRPALPRRDGAVVEGPADDSALTPETLERGRLDASWKRVVQLDSLPPGDTLRSPERWEEISAPSVDRGPMFLPLSGDVAGPSVLRVQILLERALFSPGVMDGRWGKNTESAVYWLQKREGLRATGRVDSATFSRLARLARAPKQLVEARTLTGEDVQGPFVKMPASIYNASRLDCTCYESLSEKLGERFHVTPALLRRLNPGVDLDGLTAGDRLQVPANRDPDLRADGEIAKVVVSVAGHYLHANDAAGRLLYHFPTTLGSAYDPSEGTTYRITSINPDPVWNLQPALLHVGDPTRPPVQVPPGPNNAVGNMWMALSKPHYGIHGTSAPETIGYATSSGCVRLTNWDANFLAARVKPGVPVEFHDIPPGRRQHPERES